MVAAGMPHILAILLEATPCQPCLLGSTPTTHTCSIPIRDTPIKVLLGTHNRPLHHTQWASLVAIQVSSQVFHLIHSKATPTQLTPSSNPTDKRLSPHPHPALQHAVLGLNQMYRFSFLCSVCLISLMQSHAATAPVMVFRLSGIRCVLMEKDMKFLCIPKIP